MNRIWPILFFVLCCYACKNDDDAEEVCIDESQIDPDAICPLILAPVCGCDEVTYGNSCEAEKAGVTDFVMGACPN